MRAASVTSSPRPPIGWLALIWKTSQSLRRAHAANDRRRPRLDCPRPVEDLGERVNVLLPVPSSVVDACQQLLVRSSLSPDCPKAVQRSFGLYSSLRSTDKVPPNVFLLSTLNSCLANFRIAPTRRLQQRQTRKAHRCSASRGVACHVFCRTLAARLQWAAPTPRTLVSWTPRLRGTPA